MEHATPPAPAVADEATSVPSASTPRELAAKRDLRSVWQSAIAACSHLRVLVPLLVFLGLAGGLAAMMLSLRSQPDAAADVARQPPSAVAWRGTGAGTDAGTDEDENAECDDAGSPSDAPAAPSSAEGTTHPDAADSDDASRTLEGVVKSGVPVVKNLTGLGISMSDAQLIINAMQQVYDFRRAQPGHTFVLQLDDDGRPRSFRYAASRTEVYAAQKSGDQWTARQLRIITQKKRRTFSGTITRSLFGTFNDIGASPALAAQLADILSTQVNFLKEQRPGDTFRIIVEEESLDGEFISFGPILALEYTGVKAGRKRLFRFAAGDDPATYYDEKGISVPRSVLVIPMHYARISSPFGWRFHPVLKQKKFHNGVDLTGPTGTPVWACADGKITIAGNVGPNGNLIALNHGDGLESFYAHLSRFAPGMKVGVNVRKKQVIGYVGNTGRSTGPHLHWGIKSKGQFVDPLKYKVQPGTPPPQRHRAALRDFIAAQNDALNRIAILAPKEALAEVDDDDGAPMGVTDM